MPDFLDVIALPSDKMKFILKVSKSFSFFATSAQKKPVSIQTAIYHSNPVHSW